MENNNQAGLYGFKLNGVYHLYWNGSKSDPDNLGKAIMQELKTYNDKTWVQIKKQIQSLPNPKWIGQTLDVCFSSLTEALEYPFIKFLCKSTIWEPDCDDKIKFIYIIDLDDNIFKIVRHRQTQIFNLNNLPSF
jgi:hypothetical protein